MINSNEEIEIYEKEIYDKAKQEILKHKLDKLKKRTNDKHNKKNINS